MWKWQRVPPKTLLIWETFCYWFEKFQYVMWIKWKCFVWPFIIDVNLNKINKSLLYLSFFLVCLVYSFIKLSISSLFLYLSRFSSPLYIFFEPFNRTVFWLCTFSETLLGFNLGNSLFMWVYSTPHHRIQDFLNFLSSFASFIAVSVKNKIFLSHLQTPYPCPSLSLLLLKV